MTRPAVVDLALERVPMYLRDLRFKTEKIRASSVRIVVCTFLMQPFDAALANLFGVYAHLFLNPAQPDETVKEAQLEIGDARGSGFKFEMYLGPDQGKPSIAVSEAFLGPNVKVRRDKEGPIFAGEVKIRFTYPPAKDLLFLASALNGQHWISVFDRQPNLQETDDEGADESKPARGRKKKADAPVEGEAVN